MPAVSFGLPRRWVARATGAENTDHSCERQPCSRSAVTENQTNWSHTVHNRMPVIPPPEDHKKWLGKVGDAELKKSGNQFRAGKGNFGRSTQSLLLIHNRQPYIFGNI